MAWPRTRFGRVAREALVSFWSGAGLDLNVFLEEQQAGNKEPRSQRKKAKREEEGSRGRSVVDWRVDFEPGMGIAGATREDQAVKSLAWYKAETEALIQRHWKPLESLGNDQVIWKRESHL